MLERKSETFDHIRRLRTIVSAALVCLLFLASYAPFVNGQSTLNPATSIIADGSFEIGPPDLPPDGWPLWTIQSSTNFGTPICDTIVACSAVGPLSVPRTGTNWLYFGGNSGVLELAQTGQTVDTLSPSTMAATLRFFMRVSEVDGPSFDDTVDILVDGNSVQTFTEPTVAEGAYTERQVNFVLTAGPHTVVFDYVSPDTNPETGNTNILIDDITLNVCAVTATTASISGRVLTSAGRGLANASVTLTDQLGVTRTARTNAFGFYTFDDVRVGPSYVLQVVGSRFVFSPQILTLDGDLEGVNFVAGR